MWYAKPSGGYTAQSNEGKSNIFEIYNYLSGKGYTKECVAGICGNVKNESGYNPWRWESDTVNMNRGYGLFQFTPASGYIPACSSVPYYAPNTSTSAQVPGSLATDGIAQLEVFNTDRLSKWASLCWREGGIYTPYWPKSGELWDTRRRILNKYVGEGANSITLNQFKQIDNVHDAAFVFMCCYEGPLVPNVTPRYTEADIVFEILGGTPPTPPTPTGKKMKLIYYLKRRY